MLNYCTKFIPVLLIMLLFLGGTLPAVAAEPVTVVVKLQPGTDPAQLSAEELAIVSGWKHAVVGDFYVFRYLKKHAVFLKSETPPKAYGVLALASPFEEVVGPYLPVMVKGVLLPINERIIYDGLLSTYRISFGSGIRRSLNESYKQAKESYGIITSLLEDLTPPGFPR